MLQPARIRTGHPRGLVDFRAKHHVLRVGRRPHRLERGVNRRGDQDIRHAQTHTTGGNARHIEQLFDHLRLHAGIALDHPHGMADPRPVLVRARQNRRPAEDGVERRSQLV